MIVVEIEPHQLDAMRHLVLNVRAIATTVIRDDDHRTRLINWAQMVEEVISRVETSPPPMPRK
jgi:hypothetical protein